jgi:hypothetical protein
MRIISNTAFGGERPLFESHDLRLENVIIHAGESAIKECSNIEAVNCRFEGNYPFWYVHGFVIDRCFFDVGGRSALWYSDHLKMTEIFLVRFHYIGLNGVLLYGNTARHYDKQ